MNIVSDYQLWKSARTVKPTRAIVHDIVLGLGGEKILIESVEIDLKKKFPNELLNKEDFYRFCLFNILILLRNRFKSELFYDKLITVYNDLGYKDIYKILL